jgi:hypothetical protein
MIPSLFSNLVWRARGAPSQIGKKRGWVWGGVLPRAAASAALLGYYLAAPRGAPEAGHSLAP